MPSRAKVSYEAVILCEDIRLEFDGKRTLVGAYTGDMMHVPFLPFNAVFSVYATGHVIEGGDFIPSLTISNSDGKVLYEDKSEGLVVLREGRFTQNLLVQWEVLTIGAFVVTLCDRDDALATIKYGIAVQAINSPNLQGAV